MIRTSAARQRFPCGILILNFDYIPAKHSSLRAIIRLILSELSGMDRARRTCTLRHVSGSDKPTSEHGVLPSARAIARSRNNYWARAYLLVNPQSRSYSACIFDSRVDYSFASIRHRATGNATSAN